MPHGAPDAGAQGVRLAVIAEVLYLFNLLVLPGLSLAALLWLQRRHRQKSSEVARCHLAQTVRASWWAVVALGVVSGLIGALGGWGSPWTWVVLIVYFTVGHSTLVMVGMFGLAKAMAGACWRFPIVGVAWQRDTAIERGA